MNFASFAPYVAPFASSSASPALLPLQSLFRFFFASSAFSNEVLSDKRPSNQTVCQPAFLKPSLRQGVKPGLKSGVGQRLANSHRAAGYQRATANQHSASTDSSSAVAKPLCQKPALRVVRMLESGQSPKSVGRMVISGRMADVCAELDRLVNREEPMTREEPLNREEPMIRTESIRREQPRH